MSDARCHPRFRNLGNVCSGCRAHLQVVRCLNFPQPLWVLGGRKLCCFPECRNLESWINVFCSDSEHTRWSCCLWSSYHHQECSQATRGGPSQMPYLIVRGPYEMTARFLMADVAPKNQRKSMVRLAQVRSSEVGTRGSPSAHTSLLAAFSEHSDFHLLI